MTDFYSTNLYSKAPCLIDLPQRHDARGSLGFIETEKLVRFETKRVFYLYNIKDNEERGHHAHKELQQFVFLASGSCNIKLEGKGQTSEFLLDDPSKGVYIPPMHWSILTDFSKNAVCVVLCSDFYDEADYIRDYQEFLKWEKTQ